MAFPWIKNSKGEPSASLTMSAVAFLAVTAWLLAWLIGAALGAPVPPFDAGSAMAYLTPILSLYWGRRFTESKFKKDEMDIKFRASEGRPTEKTE